MPVAQPSLADDLKAAQPRAADAVGNHRCGQCRSTARECTARCGSWLMTVTPSRRRTCSRYSPGPTITVSPASCDGERSADGRELRRGGLLNDQRPRGWSAGRTGGAGATSGHGNRSPKKIRRRRSPAPRRSGPRARGSATSAPFDSGHCTAAVLRRGRRRRLGILGHVRRRDARQTTAPSTYTTVTLSLPPARLAWAMSCFDHRLGFDRRASGRVENLARGHEIAESPSLHRIKRLVRRERCPDDLDEVIVAGVWRALPTSRYTSLRRGWRIASSSSISPASSRWPTGE